MDRTSEQSSARPRRWVAGRSTRRLVACSLVAVATAFGGLAACSVSSADATAVRLDQAGEAGPDPFTDSVSVTEVSEFPTDVRVLGAEVLGRAEPAEAGGASFTLAGTEPGLYGGSNEKSVCDPERLVRFLTGDDAKAKAWASVFDIPVAGIPEFVDGLTPTVLLVDTRVTNHGFSDGTATDVQAVLQAGTAVLVDDRGTPRVKCNCGNPLAPPEEIERAEYTGERWTGFDPDALLAVEAGAPATELAVVDLQTGETIDLPVGSGGPTGWVAAVRRPGSRASTIVTSTDGSTWRDVATIDDAITGLAQGPDGWVAVGGLFPNVVFYNSTDLETWKEVADLSAGMVYDLAYGDGRFVAVGDYVGGPMGQGGVAFSTPMVHTSTDGVTWTTDNDPFGADGTRTGNRQPVAAVTHVPDLGFVVTATHADDTAPENPYSMTMFRSEDGTRWSPASPVEGDGPQLIEMAGDVGGFSATALAAGNGVLVQAARPWTPPTNPDGLGEAPRVEAPIVVYDPPSTLGSVPCPLCVPEGTAIDDTPFEDIPVAELAFGGGRFLAVIIGNGEGGSFAYRSSDARSWERAGPIVGEITALEHGRLGDRVGGPGRPPDQATTTTTTQPAPDTTAPPAATTLPPAPVTTSPPAPPGPSALGQGPTLTESAASGAGCTPPSGAVLPDGWWFGYRRSSVRAGAAFDFDLACFYYGAIGGKKAHEEDPVNNPTEEPVPNDVYISNRNTAVRSLSVAPAAELVCIDMNAGINAYEQQPRCPSPGADWAIWVRIEGGTATRIVEQFQP